MMEYEIIILDRKFTELVTNQNKKIKDYLDVAKEEGNLPRNWG